MLSTLLSDCGVVGIVEPDPPAARQRVAGSVRGPVDPFPVHLDAVVPRASPVPSRHFVREDRILPEQPAGTGIEIAVVAAHLALPLPHLTLAVLVGVRALLAEQVAFLPATGEVEDAVGAEVFGPGAGHAFYA